MLTKELYSVSCVICHHKSDLVLKAIQSLKAQRYVNVEIIVVTSEPNRTFYNTKTYFVKGGPDRKRNESLKLCSHDLIAFFDDDINANSTCVYEMAKKLDQPSIGMVFGKTLNMEHRDMFDEAGSFLTWTGFLWARGSHQKDEGQFNVCEPVLAGKSASCMIKRNVFVEVGKFDTDYEILAEETFLAWKVWLWGYNVLYAPRSVAFHAFATKYKPADMYIPKRIYFNGCKNYCMMLITCLSLKNLIKILPIHITAWILSGIGMFLSRKFTASFYIFKGLFYIVINIKSILSKRKFVQSNRKVSDTELFKVFMKSPSLKYYIHRFFTYLKVGLHG